MLSDSVGLGKTTTSIEVIKHYLNDPSGKKRVEIICPASIQEQWEKELSIQGIYGRRPISLQNKSEIDSKMELDSIASVSLFVIDESHNLRQSNGKRFQQLLDWIRNNPNSHVLLVTATPINNNLVDLSNQILLGLGGKADVFKITVTGENKQTQQITFHAAIENLRKKIQQDLTRDGKVDFEKIRETMIPIIRNFVVRRTRQGITSEYGGLIIDGEFQKFPTVKPEILKYQFDPDSIGQIKKIKSEILNLDKIYSLDPNEIVDKCKNLSHPVRQISNIEITEETKNEIESPIFYLFQLILLLGFVPYKWKMYQKDFYGKSRKQIHELTIPSKDRKKLLLQISIFGILRTVYLKRLESSVEALRISIENYEVKLDYFKKGIQKGEIYSVTDLENYIENVDDDSLSEELFDENAFQGTIDDESYNLKALLEDIDTEQEILKVIKLQLKIINHDDVKLNVLLETMEKIQQVNPDQKILVFSYFSDTINYLSNNIHKRSKIFNDKNVGFVSSKTKSDSEKLASLFSPKSKNYKLKNYESELNYLFSTDILSEGQNLQDAGILINYDLHWNPVRMIQRNGRVNRLGSKFDQVTIFNMRPEVKLDTYLKLIQRLQGKIDMIKNTIGTDSPVLDEPENPIEFSDSIQEIYSDNLEKRLKAISDAEKAADYLLAEDEFVIDLKKFHNDDSLGLEYKRSIYNMPNGKWAKYPKINFAGKDRPKMIALAKLSSESDSTDFHQFVEVNSEKMQINAVNQLQALEWLKTEPSDDIRSQDNVIFERNSIKDLIEKNVLVFAEEPEMGALIGQENQILKLLYLAQHPQESIEQVRKAFKSKNIFFKQDMTKIKRRIMQKYNQKENYDDDLTEIVTTATKIINHSENKKNTSYNKSNLVMVYLNED
jgi:superfamily II DNA/RNA helicase